MNPKEISEGSKQEPEKAITDNENDRSGLGLTSTVVVERRFVLYGMGAAFIGGIVIGGLLVAFLLRAGGWK